MIKKITLSIVCALLINTLSVAQWVSIDNNSLPNSKPNVQLISDDITGTVIKIELPGFRINEFNADGKTYHSIDLGSLGITTEVGRPEIPHIAKILAIPDQGTISVEVLEIGESKIIKGINIPPVRESWIEGKPETPYLENEESYSSENLYPQEIVRVEDPAVFRDFRIARVSIFPIRYSPAKQEIEVYSSITIRVNYGSGLGTNPKLTPKKPIATSFAKLYKSFIFNYEEVLQREYNGDEEGHDIMLCITPDIYIEEFQPYADWKNKSGTEIFITKFSEIGATQSDPQPIKDHIQNVYNTWSNPPTHVLLVGDYGTVTNCVPRKEITLDGWTFATEDWFVELAGNDYFPEMMIGRWTHHANGGEERLQIMVDKFLRYEKYPATTGNDWYKKGIVCSNNYYQSQVETKRQTAQKMMQYGNFISVDTMMMVYPSGCNYYLPDVISAINSGRSFLNYRGEGWSYGWWANCYEFRTSDVSTLTNYNKLTFVTSIGCGVAMFDNNVQCFGEEWIEMGSIGEDPKGGCAFIGPTSNTHTAWNNWIDRGIYVGMFEEGLDSPGEALLRGKLYMYEVFGGSDPYVEYHYKVYCILGDPSLHVWKDLPRAVSVDYPDSISIGNNQVQITVTDSATGLPVENAQVCISGDSVYAVGLTSVGGTLILDINTVSAVELDIVVRGGTVVPLEGTIQVVDSVASTFQLTVTIEDGWNMTSIPGLHPVDQDVLTWWPNLTGTVWGFNGVQYMPQTIATPGEGYWMENTVAETYNYPAIGIVPHAPIPATAGWNMIGGYETSPLVGSLTTDPVGQLTTGIVWGYNGVQYVQATNLVPGYGYWIEVDMACNIIIPATPLAKGSGEVVEYFKDDWGRITLTDAAGKSYILYAVKGEVDLDLYKMPPLPPAGSFDIRFGSDRIAEDINSSIQSIDMAGIEYPIIVKVENMNIRLQDETGNQINENIKSGEEITISNASINKLMVTGEMIPDVYALEQNYPNPFNPSTTIEFSLPEVSNVKLTIYDALGQKVTVLVNTSLQAGRYSYQWDARNVSTGMYIYELRTDKFASIKKMMILK
jgi:hypothetical protein